jgi:2,4-dichlorophenol 6-monooxygenase
MLLSQIDVETLLVSALPTTSVLPKAHVLNQRAMEVFSDLGVAAEIYARGTPPENMRYSAYYAGFTGPEPVFGRQIGRMESWGAGASTPTGPPRAPAGKPICRRSDWSRS